MANTAKLLPEVNDDALLAALKERMASPDFAAKVAEAHANRDQIGNTLSSASANPILQTFPNALLAPAIERAWGFTPPENGNPFEAWPREALERARDGYGLTPVQLMEKMPDGTVMNMENMNAMQAKDGRNGKLLYNTDWYKNEAFFRELPRSGTRLMGMDVLHDSTNKTEVQQLELIVRALRDIFQGSSMPAHYAGAIAQFEARKAQIKTLMESEKDWPKASAMIEALDLCRLTRATPVEMIQAIETQHQNDGNGAFPFSNVYVRTPRRSSVGRLVSVGNVLADGALVNDYHPGDRAGLLGVALSLQS